MTGWIAPAVLVLTSLSAAVSAQSALPAGSVLDTRIPPNAIDRATASTDARRADQARAADADRVAAENRAHTARATQSAPITQSTLTDGVSGLGTRTDTRAEPVSGPR